MQTSHRRKFSQDQVREIRKLRSLGATYPYLAQLFEADTSTLFSIVNHQTYRDIK